MNYGKKISTNHGNDLYQYAFETSKALKILGKHYTMFFPYGQNHNLILQYKSLYFKEI